MSLIINNFVDCPKMSIFSLTITVLNFCITGCKNISNPIKLKVMTQQEISNRLEIQGLWYNSIVVHTADGWRIKEHIEYDYWKDNMPDGFKF